MEIEDHRSLVVRQVTNLSFERKALQMSKLDWTKQMELEKSLMDEELRAKGEKSKVMELAIQEMQ